MNRTVGVISFLALIFLFMLPFSGVEASESPELSLSKKEGSAKPGEKLQVVVTVLNTAEEKKELTLLLSSEKESWAEFSLIEGQSNKTISIKENAVNLTLNKKENLTLILEIKVPVIQEKGDFAFDLSLIDRHNKTKYAEEHFILKVEPAEANFLLFFLALLPLLVIFVGIIKFRQPGMRMSLVGWLVSVLLAMVVFKTTFEVTFWATLIGLIKSLGITLAVMFTMFMIFLMKETGALKTIAESAKNVVKTKEEQAIFLGIGFGSFLTSLGVVTPALFPPLLVTMGFTPFAAVAISVLGYNATTSFALLSIPITLPATIFGEDPYEFALKISIFLPVISVALSFAILWVIGGKESVKKGKTPAILSGLSLGITTLLFVWVDYTLVKVVSIKVVGVFSSLLTMVIIYFYSNWKELKAKRKDKTKKSLIHIFKEKKELLYALSPWIILVALVSLTSLPGVEETMKDLPGDAEKIDIKGDVTDLNILSKVYTWILISTFLSIPLLKPSKDMLNSAFKTWRRRVIEPSVSYSVYFAIAFVMAKSSMEIQNGRFTPLSDFASYNMNSVLGTFLADTFGSSYILVGISLGVFGAIAGGSETTSNILFYKVQKTAATNIGLSHSEFMTLYGGHAVAGGVASAITPAKITNAVSTISEKPELEVEVMRSHLLLVFALTVVVALMTAIFILVGI